MSSLGLTRDIYSYLYIYGCVHASVSLIFILPEGGGSGLGPGTQRASGRAGGVVPRASPERGSPGCLAVGCRALFVRPGRFPPDEMKRDVLGLRIHVYIIRVCICIGLTRCIYIYVYVYMYIHTHAYKFTYYKFI